MRLRNIPGAREEIENNPFCIKNPENYKNKWSEVFENDHPLHIEVGMGKGQFIYTLAAQNPEINYIGIEKYSSVLLRALQKMDESPLDNLKFIRMDAEYITDAFGRDDVQRIYLNFSDPWPKDRHAKRRLTSGRFMSFYDTFLSKDGYVQFKTDNDSLFEFSLKEIPAAGWHIFEQSYDFHNDEKLSAGNIMTEYEEKFSSLGHPIHMLRASR